MPFVSLGGGDGRRRDDLGDRWLFRNELGYGVWGYDEVVALLRDDRWHSAVARMAPEGDEEFERWRAERQQNLLALEGDDHQRLRSVLAPALTPGRVEQLRPFVRDTIDELLAPVVRRGGGELVAEVCEPYPRLVIFELLGASPSAVDDFASLTATVPAAGFNPAADPDTIIEATEALDGFSAQLVDGERSSGGDGLLSTLVAARAAGAVSEPELISLVNTLLLAGTESTRGQLGCAISLFARFPDQYQLLRARPELASAAVEETMRYLGTVRGTARIASTEVVLRDVAFDAGTMMVVSLTGANRHPAIGIDRPGRFEIDRAPGRAQLTFGHGLHYCVGASLARIELQEAFAALGRSVDRIDLAGDIEWLPPNTDFWGPRQLPVTTGG